MTAEYGGVRIKNRDRAWHLGRFIVVLTLAIVPLKLLVDSYIPGHGFLSLVHFGEKFESRRLPEINEFVPPLRSRGGYDGQFYAQLALHPSLQGEGIEKALDAPAYRARRIGLPVIATGLGFGRTEWVLNVYSVLNFVFWALLMGLLLRFIDLHRWRDVLLFVALLWTNGTLVSCARALIDLPAAVLGVAAVLTPGAWLVPVLLLSASALIKDTSVLSFAAVPWLTGGSRRLWRMILSMTLLTIPLLLWVAYVQVMMGDTSNMGSGNFSWPFWEVVQKLDVAIRDLYSNPQESFRQLTRKTFEVLCPLSLCVQAIYLFIHPRLRTPAWWLGIGFAVLLLVLGSSVWVENNAYSRVLLPLTMAFNLLIHQYEQGRSYCTWYVTGNIGMIWMLLNTIF
jgi:hypothetical protein